LVARLVRDEEAGSSNLPHPTIQDRRPAPAVGRRRAAPGQRCFKSVGTPSDDWSMAGNRETWTIDRARSPRVGATRHRRTFSLLAAVLTVTLLSGVLTSCETTPGERAAVINAINQSRAQHGLPALRENGALNNKADAWARTMRDQCRIWHSRLSDGAPGGWRKLGENVGRGGSIQTVHVAYMNSSGHRRNILDRSFNQVGAGAVWGDCGGRRTVFTVQVFMQG